MIIVDIEGAEFDVLGEEFLEAFSKSAWIIEIHDEFSDQGPVQYEQLKNRCARYFNLTEIRTGARDLSTIPEVEFLDDHSRWLICSESRGRLGKWLMLNLKLAQA